MGPPSNLAARDWWSAICCLITWLTVNGESGDKVQELRQLYMGKLIIVLNITDIDFIKSD